MYRKKLLFVVLAIWLLPNYAISKNTFQEGFIITNKQDTIRGLIDIKESSFINCCFKKLPNSPVEIFKPGEIIGYRISNGKFYTSMNLPIKKSYKIIQYIRFISQTADPDDFVVDESKYEDSTTVVKHVFAEYLLNGAVKLYYFKDENKKDHYYIHTSNNQIQELVKEIVESYSNGVITAVTTKPKYRETLLGTLMDFKLAKEIERLTLNHYSLIKISKKYHETICKNDECIIYKRDITPTTYNWAIHLGYQHIQMPNTGLLTGKIYETNLKPTAPPVRIGMDLIINNVLLDNNNFGFRISLDYWYSKYVNNNYQSYIDRSKYAKLSFSTNNINMDLDGTYKFISKSRTPFAEIGLSSCLTFGSKYQDIDNSWERFDTENNFGPLKGLKVGANCSLGYQFPINKEKNKISFKISYTQFRKYSLTGFSAGFTL